MQQDNYSTSASVGALLLGLLGAPAVVGLAWAFRNFVPIFFFCAASLAYIYLAQPRFVNGENGRRSRVARIGIVLTLVWAVPVLIWSAIFSVTSK
jgi:hypothetical protein